MLWLCIALPQLPLEAQHVSQHGSSRAETPDAPIVVTACEGNTRWVVCCNPAAGRGGIKAAMSYNVALAMHPALTSLERNLKAEQAALTRLAAWAYQFSSTVIPGEINPQLHLARTSTLWLEIGASLKLFGGLRPLLASLESGLEQLGYSYRLGIAPTLEGAALLARAGIRVAITTLPALGARIRNLPLTQLALLPGITRDLHTTGVRTIGLLLDLPRAALARRFGPGLGDFLDRLTGLASDPRPVFKLPAEYDAHFEFDHEVRNTEALLFVMRRLLHEFAGFLRARDTAVQHFTVTLVHRDVPATAVHVGLSVPERNAAAFFALVREHLERLELPAPTLELRLSARQFVAPTALQTDLLNQAAEQTETLAHTLDRLTARLGAEQVHGIKAHADHRPEASWAPAPLSARRESLHFPDRPLWLLPEPRPLQLPAAPLITSGPERIEAGWWDTQDLQRDYYVVHTCDGADLWVYRDLEDSGWYLHGFWS